MKAQLKIIAGVSFFAITICTHGAPNLIDFETPLPGGLVSATHQHLAPVPAQAIVSTQYVSLGVKIQGAALMNLGSSSPSGVNCIGGMDSQGRFNSGAPLTITFVSPADGNIRATTDYFSVTPDIGNNSDNSTAVYAYALDGSFLGGATYQETGITRPASPIILTNIGRIHRVVIASTLHDSASGWGGIQFDLLSYATVRPEPVLAVRVSQMELCWDTIANISYQLQFRSTLTTNQWSNYLSSIQGTGSRQCIPVAVPAEQGQLFFRVVTLP